MHQGQVNQLSIIKFCLNYLKQPTFITFRQNYSMNNEEPENMIIIQQSEFYQDLSAVLAHFREVLSMLLLMPAKNIHIDEALETIQERHDSTQFTLVLEKYRKIGTIQEEFGNITQRFIIRIKQLLRHFMNTAPRYRVAVDSLIRNLQLNTAKYLQSCSYKMAINFVFEFINSFSSKVIQKYSSSTKTLRVETHSPTAEMRISNNSGDLNKNYLQFKTTKRQTEAEQFMKHASKYDCMDVDMQHLRGRYFNLKKNQKKEMRQVMQRNQYIKQLINNFQKNYQTGKQKIVVNRILSRSIDKKRKNTYATISQKFNLENTEEDNIECLNRHKENNFLTLGDQRGSSIQRKTQKTIQTAKIKSSSFREIYEEKLKECRNVKLKNVVICEQLTPLVTCNPNSKKAQFFKKSKEQTKFRYKYYTYVRKEDCISSKCLKPKNVNPQIIFTTLTYK